MITVEGYIVVTFKSYSRTRYSSLSCWITRSCPEKYYTHFKSPFVQVRYLLLVHHHVCKENINCNNDLSNVGSRFVQMKSNNRFITDHSCTRL